MVGNVGVFHRCHRRRQMPMKYSWPWLLERGCVPQFESHVGTCLLKHWSSSESRANGGVCKCKVTSSVAFNWIINFFFLNLDCTKNAEVRKCRESNIVWHWTKFCFHVFTEKYDAHNWNRNHTPKWLKDSR